MGGLFGGRRDKGGDGGAPPEPPFTTDMVTDRVKDGAGRNPLI